VVQLSQRVLDFTDDGTVQDVSELHHSIDPGATITKLVTPRTALSTNNNLSAGHGAQPGKQRVMQFHSSARRQTCYSVIDLSGLGSAALHRNETQRNLGAYLWSGTDRLL
jgi:hypothetical protein